MDGLSSSPLSYVVSDIEELNLIRNDIGFLVQDILGGSIDTSVPIKDGIYFFIWVSLNYKNENNKNCHTIFPFDLLFVRKNVSFKDVALIQKILKNQTKVRIFTRKFGDTLKERI